MIIGIQDITLDLAGSRIELAWSDDAVPAPVVTPVTEYGKVVLVEDLDGDVWTPLKKAQ